ncbi:MAG: 50S ribosomal protein L11 methyltransferase [Verrucomicrobiales bacterium]|nr:50S ribosomal protein L11 methyltransferase [Verrucomicrobiales bacterium]
MFVWSKLSSPKWADAWEERFSGGHPGQLVITESPNKKMIRLELYCPEEKGAEAVQKEFGGTIRRLKNQNWAALQPEPPPPVKIRDQLVVCSGRTDAECRAMREQHPGREVLFVPADMAFGTGHHATTATMLRFICDIAQERRRAKTVWTLADLGCGSGILAIAARRLGASVCWGCDFDPAAVRVAKENAERNATPEVPFEEVDVLKWKPKRRYDVVVANLFSTILIEAYPTIGKVVAPGGIVLLSGILNTQADECLAAAEASGLKIQRRVRVGKWVTAWTEAPI